MNTQRVLVVDDEPDIRELLEITLGRMGLATEAASGLGDAESRLGEQRFDLCLTDMRLPDGNGIDLVRTIQTRHPQLPVAVITAYGSMETAIEALKAGAFDFVTKPVDLESLRNLVNSAIALPTPKTTSQAGPGESLLLGDSPPMQALRAMITKVARSQAPVFIVGESGTGKELVARSIHAQSPRAQGPFIPVNCGAIPAELMESELFGHLRGSFTGAVDDQNGLFQAAHGGTLFLDEIIELPIHLQVKLLRAIQERAIRPVGAQREVRTDVRILSASHKDIAAEVSAGRFRQDLFYRVNVIELRVPPLRERNEDLTTLADHFLKRLASHWGVAPPPLANEAMQALREYPFPGNVRELENVIERAATLCEGSTIRAADLALKPTPPADIAATGKSTPGDDSDKLEEVLEDKERQLIRDALERHRWNRTAAARELGLTLRQLRYRLDKLSIG